MSPNIQVSVTTLLYLVLTGATCFVLGFFLRKLFSGKQLKEAEDRSKTILEQAKKDAGNRRKEAELEAKDLLFRTKGEFEKETKERRQELMGLERRLVQREENLDRKVDILERKERSVNDRDRNIGKKERALSDKEKELEGLISEEKTQLQTVSGMTRDDAKRLLIKRMEDEAKHDAAKMIKRIDDEAKLTADKQARKVVGLAIQRCAADHTVESTVSVVQLPGDEMKGRIIGREGRNIRALEIATGIDVIIDDTPEAVILSGFDMVRREIAR
ncbi:MAG: DUF3552 domain-containing protein, partial [Candidatus Omnitrophica bacterium]|nr:DUF3552 domain-containing protein [Candidatus Omnitrophota bacterium]